MLISVWQSCPKLLLLNPQIISGARSGVLSSQKSSSKKWKRHGLTSVHGSLRSNRRIGRLMDLRVGLLGGDRSIKGEPAIKVAQGSL